MTGYRAAGSGNCSSFSASALLRAGILLTALFWPILFTSAAVAKECFTDRIGCLEVCEDGSQRELTKAASNFEKCWPQSGPRRQHAEREKKRRSLAVHVKSERSREVQFKLYSQGSSKRQWPSKKKVWFLTDSKSMRTEIACPPNEQICFGAWEVGTRNYWGCGVNCSSACKACCKRCGTSELSMTLSDSEKKVKLYKAMALAWNNKGAWQVWVSDNIGDAKRSARSACNRKYGRCSLSKAWVHSHSFGCMAVARARSNHLFVQVNSTTRGDVRREVLRNCRRKRRGCKIQYAHCNG
ncbi:MAG: DUF4189 domain-containing protein [Alphaproteobacteria bacterium]|nr:DUF4189 domain-containing protein [Alphaproteobacteria bacterium]